MTKTNLDKINSFLGHLDSQVERLNNGDLESLTDSSMISSSAQARAYSTNNSRSQTQPQAQQPQQSQQTQQKVQNQFQNQGKINNSQIETPKSTFKKSSVEISNPLSPQDEINFDIEDEDRKSKRSWCERSLEQLEMTIQLLDQCLDNDIKDLNRQEGVISLCRKQIEEAKKVIAF